MQADHWKTQIVLNEGEQLKHEGSRTSGFMGEEDIESYSVIGPDGAKVGSITVRDHTAVKGFRRTIYAIQNDLAGKVIAETRYTVS
ncbi:hypothetical protein [Roseateles amylovorans]|uniref:Uncharacterized protein n=1 Tax=Roseateles amylovorans TaxID=2978473 RepID=A0ABY6B651_9BURK|nr:hypothetical protein [Roseateles amylovorans]UXH79995.1 hypothetical protein N4261_08985 [Roseateles amylovorans]